MWVNKLIFDIFDEQKANFSHFKDEQKANFNHFNELKIGPYGPELIWYSG